MDRKIMYICMCNALTDQQIKQAVAANGLQRLSDVYAACGSRAQCGQCAHAMLRVARDHVCMLEQGIKSAA
jgi:bacterioferritin-associated ferredoxin